MARIRDKWSVGDKWQVMSPTRKRREVTILEVQEDYVKIHYDGFPAEYDERIASDSDRWVQRLQREESGERLGWSKMVTKGKQGSKEGFDGVRFKERNTDYWESGSFPGAYEYVFSSEDFVDA